MINVGEIKSSSTASVILVVQETIKRHSFSTGLSMHDETYVVVSNTREQQICLIQQEHGVRSSLLPPRLRVYLRTLIAAHSPFILLPLSPVLVHLAAVPILWQRK